MEYAFKVKDTNGKDVSFYIRERDGGDVIFGINHDAGDLELFLSIDQFRNICMCFFNITREEADRKHRK